MRESQIEEKICAHARKLGMLVYKFVSPNQRGVPDRMLVTAQGTVWFIEVKAPGKKPTALQTAAMERLRCRKLTAWWVDNAEDGKTLVETMALK